MGDINPRSSEFQEYRQAIRDLCGRFDSQYWQEVEERAGYPEAFVKALTEAGWLAALIPEQYGGGGLSVTEASVILEEINRSGANSGACHAQMYIMGALLRHGSDEQKQQYLPAIASGALRLQSFAVTEPTTGTDTTKTRTVADQVRRPLHRQRPEGVDLQDSALGPDAAAGADDAARRDQEEDRRPLDLPRRPARRRAAGDDRPSDQEHGQPRDQRSVLRQLRGARPPI